ncbi:MAG: ABC transporter substrate-binding protein, partial [Thermoplasmata archaeon]|nr:ABC transporter substrate-binding protein [Thermoplasmata archaeon]
GRKTAVIVVAVVLLAGSFAAGYYVGFGAFKPLTSGNLTVIDDMGREVLVPDGPRRIISLAPSTTELLFALDMGDRIIAKDNNSDYPEEAKLIRYNVSGYKWIDYEVIISLDPDIIFAAGINLEWVPELESRGFTVVVLEPMSIEGVFDNIRLVGTISGNMERANELLLDLRNRVNLVTEKTQVSDLSKPKVYLEIYAFLGYYTFGSGSFGNELIVLAGGINIAANVSEMYPALTSEFVVASDPEVIIYTTNQWITTTPDVIKGRVGWGGISAVITDNIHSIDDNLVSRPGPRLVDGLEALAELIHPDLFA